MAYRVSIVRTGKVASSAETAELRAVDDSLLATVDIAPPLLAGLTVREARRTARPTAPDPELLRLAGKLFANDTLDGLSPEGYCEMQARAAGVPIRVARRSIVEMETTFANMGARVAAERPAGAGQSVRPGQIEPVWVRRGDVLAVVAPSNNPGTHTQWIQAVANGYQVVVRPGAKDPFTPARMIAAMLAAGIPPTALSLLPGGHATGDALVEAADLSLVFGGDTAMARYGGNRSVIMRGPGRSKLLHSGPITESVLDTIAASVGYDGGMRCTNASAVFTDADPGELAGAVAERLARLNPAPPQSPDAELPVLPAETARALRAQLESRLAGAVDVAVGHYSGGPVADLGDGSAAMRPAVLLCATPDHPGSAIELPFPCVWILPWRRELGMAPLGDTLALTVLSEDRTLAEEALRTPAIRKVLFGPLPTWSQGPVSPHDGMLGHALMEARAFGVAR
ncbi:MAG TPA: aldehyde dehydrogenase family protein [Actinophytocola sp.]|uniref:aldehyde dehydrogenase family protein n=1 Tax=Actinophytocola sp. TaxID=1872138 RepID=UPI002DDCAD29|nr:aldehyde dehydrogenase family protein [Actinophytocola sp.]HEV2778121.1 aldehyde dehydrogenase family protein [Actinophytocola sp.]